MSHKKQIEIYQFNNRAKYWLVRADGGKYYDDFKYNHFISIHHNQVTLADLQTDDLLLTTEKTIEHYKQQIARVYQDESLSKHQITFTAKRLYSSVEDMSIGDYVIVPSFKSNYFLIGQITSDVYEKERIDEGLALNHGYDQSTDIKRRNVKWINEVPRRKVNPKFLYSTLTVHHTIFNISDLSKYIDGLISPLYFKGVKFKGFLPYLQGRKKASLEERKLAVEVETMEKDAELKDLQREIEKEKARQTLASLREVRDLELTVDAPNISYENASQTQMDSYENQDEG